MKTLVLTINNIKRFIRDWKSIVLLIGFPLIIVAAIFASFSPNELSVPIGAVDNTENFSYEDFEEASSSFADLKQYNNLQGCLKDIKKFKTYGCAVIDRIEGKNQYIINIYYDNTKEVIDKTILGGIRGVASNMQIRYSEERASQALNKIENLTQDIRSARTEVQETDRNLEREITNLDEKISSLRQTRNNLKVRLEEMDEDVNDAEENIETISETREEYYSNTSDQIEKVETSLNIAEQSTDQEIEELNNAQETVSEIDGRLDHYNDEIESDIEDVNEVIEDYRDFRTESRTYLAEINQTIRDLEQTKSELSTYRTRLQKLDRNLADMEEEYSKAADMEAEEVANFVETSRTRVYNPEKTKSNLLVLQTIFSTLLFLVSLFVSILISKFVTLNKIRSKAKKRIEVTPNTFLAEYISVYLTSLIIVIIPVICVLAFGEHFFKLKIMENTSKLSIILFIFCSSLINFGIASAHLIRDKSITLLIGSFTIVFMIFFSGFVLPIEMMSNIPKYIATVMPGNAAKEAFDILVLYNQPLKSAKSQIYMLVAWNIIFTGLALQTKKYRD